MRPLITSLRNTFLAGLAFAIPLITTGWILFLVYEVIKSVSQPIVRGLFRFLNLVRPPGPEIVPPQYVLDFLGFVIIVTIFLALGFMAKNVIGKRVLSTVDRMLLTIPVFALIYNGLKQMIDSFKSLGTSRRFKRVVYVEYPSPGCRLIGFVTGQYFDRQIDKNVTCVFIPTSPNPMTGFTLVMEDEKLLESDLSLEEASKMVVTAGLINPLGSGLNDTASPMRNRKGKSPATTKERPKANV